MDLGKDVVHDSVRSSGNMAHGRRLSRSERHLPVLSHADVLIKICSGRHPDNIAFSICLIYCCRVPSPR